jgi:hypothetical protein
MYFQTYLIDNIAYFIYQIGIHVVSDPQCPDDPLRSSPISLKKKD